MAVATKPTLLSLNQFAEIMEVSPFAFNQLDINQMGRTSDCGVWYQWAWQNSDMLNREIVARAISEAEHMLAENMGFWPAPRYTTAERIDYPRPYKKEYWNVWYNSRWKLNSVRTHYGRIWAMGIPAHDVISASEAIVTSDEDGDGIDDWFTVGPIATALTDESEIGVYIRDADRNAWMPMDEECWRIRPVRVVIAGGFVTISGPLWYLVDPALLVPPTPQPINPTIAASFVANLKVQRYYTDTSDQGTVSLEHVACNGTQCSNIEVDACFGERNPNIGIILPEATETSWPLGQPTCCTGNCYYAPDFVSVNYLSGAALSSGGGVVRVDNTMAQMIARLAVTLLPERFCGDCLEHEIEYWREIPSENEIDTLSQNDMDNPLGGVRRGTLWAWHRIVERNSYKRVGAIL